jgi:hypothetical protein
MSAAVLVREWGEDAFHHRVLEFEIQGYIARRETYRITPEMNPETGEIIHLHTIEIFSSETTTQSSDGEDTVAMESK